MAKALATVSPLARRLRLAAEVRRLRGDRPAAEIAKAAGIDRTVVSKVEAGERRTSLDTILALLDALPVEHEHARELVTVARTGTANGWWNVRPYTNMGTRQAKIADLECGASVWDYQPSMLPGLLQTERYARHRARFAVDGGSDTDIDATVQARLRRQKAMFEEGSGEYVVVLEPQAIQRLAVPPDVMREQLLHLHKLAVGAAKVEVRVLPVDARLAEGWVPRHPFAVYQYTDPRDLALVAVDTVSEDLVLTAPEVSENYARRFEELRAAAMSIEDSAALIHQAVNKLTAGA